MINGLDTRSFEECKTFCIESQFFISCIQVSSYESFKKIHFTLLYILAFKKKQTIKKFSNILSEAKKIHSSLPTRAPKIHRTAP